MAKFTKNNEFQCTFVNEMNIVESTSLQLEENLVQFKDQGKKIVVTSSFQTQSLPLLHLLSKSQVGVDILFIDTGFHFPETYHYLDTLESLFSLNIIRIKPEVEKAHQLSGNQFLYNTQPDYCCHINKVLPLDNALENYDVWISGVRRDQTQFRKNLEEKQLLKNGQLKYHPMLEWSSKEVYEYIKDNDLPEHPLAEKGYLSIGCMPCTRSVMEDMQREGRWYGRNKKECGIHLNR